MYGEFTHQPYSVEFFQCNFLFCSIWWLQHKKQFFRNYSEAVTRRCSVKKVLEISQNSQENTCVRVSFLKSCRPQACNFIKKETLPQVFSCEFCEISNKTYSYRTPPGATSDYSQKGLWQFTAVLLWILRNF